MVRTKRRRRKPLGTIWEVPKPLWQRIEPILKQFWPRSLPAADPQPGDVLEQRMAALQRGIKRLIDSYQDGLIEKEEFEPRFGFRR